MLATRPQEKEGKVGMLRKKIKTLQDVLNGRRKGKERGAVLVEFILVFPVLFLLIIGIVEFGFAWRETSNIARSVGQSNRIAANLTVNGYADVEGLFNLRTATGVANNSRLFFAEDDYVIFYNAASLNNKNACRPGGSMRTTNCHRFNAFEQRPPVENETGEEVLEEERLPFGHILNSYIVPPPGGIGPDGTKLSDGVGKQNCDIASSIKGYSPCGRDWTAGISTGQPPLLGMEARLTYRSPLGFIPDIKITRESIYQVQPCSSVETEGRCGN